MRHDVTRPVAFARQGEGARGAHGSTLSVFTGSFVRSPRDERSSCGDTERAGRASAESTAAGAGARPFGLGSASAVGVRGGALAFDDLRSPLARRTSFARAPR
jgi:hypothetical protein